MLSKKIILLADKNKDSKIHIEEHNNEDKIRFITEGQQRMIISNSTTSGNIGIGLNFNNPTSTLDIQGDLAVSNKVGIGTNNPQYKLDVDGDINISAGNKLRIGGTEFSGGSGGGQWNTVNTNEIEYSLGNVGIGTNNPQYKLDVDGDINISAGNKLRIGGTEFSGSATGSTADGAVINQHNHTFQQTDIQQIITVPGGHTGVSIPVLDTLIIPTSASSTIEITAHIKGEWNASHWNTMAYIKRDIYTSDGTTIESSTELRNTTGSANNAKGISNFLNVYTNDADDSMEEAVILYYDKPNIANRNVVYKVFIMANNNNTFYFNRTKTNSDISNYEATISSMSVEEKGALSVQLSSSISNIKQLGKLNKSIIDSSDKRNLLLATNNSTAELTELQIKITPKSILSKIKLQGVVNGECGSSEDANTGIIIKKTVNGVDSFLTHTGSAPGGTGAMISPFTINFHNESGSTGSSCSFMVFDSPNTTDEITYTPVVLYSGGNTNITFHFNSVVITGDGSNIERFRSSFSADDDYYETFILENPPGVDTKMNIAYKDTSDYELINISGSDNGDAISKLEVKISPRSASSTIKLEGIINGDLNTSEDFNLGIIIKKTINGVDSYLRSDRTVSSGTAAMISPFTHNFNNNDMVNISEKEGINCNFMVFDSPNTTDEITYTPCLMFSGTSSPDFHLNSVIDQTDGDFIERFRSSFSASDDSYSLPLPTNAQLTIPSNIAYKSSNTTATQLNINANTEGAFFDDNQSYNFGKVIIQPLSTNSVMKITCHVAGEFDNPGALHNFGLYIRRTQNGVVNEIRGSNSMGLISHFYKIIANTNLNEVGTTADICDFVVIDDTPFNDTSPVEYQLMYKHTTSPTYYQNSFNLNSTINSATETFKSTFLVEDLYHNSYAVEGNNTATTGVLNRQMAKVLDYYQVSVSANADNIVNDMFVNITPKSTSSKIKLDVYLCGEFNNTESPQNSVCALKRTINGVETILCNVGNVPTLTSNAIKGIAPFTIVFMTNADTTMENCSFIFVDEPNTTANVKYELIIRSSITATFDMNRTNVLGSSGDIVGTEVGISTMSAEDDYFDISSIKADSYWENNSTNISYNNGYVGIGTSNPESTLDIKMTYPEYVIINSTDNSGIKIKNDTSTYDSLIYTSGNTLRFHTNGDRMAIREDGNILFGCSELPSSNSGGAGFEVASYDRMILKLATTRLDHSRLVGFYTPNGMMGDIQTTTTGCLFQSLSDYRVKENIIYNFDATTSFKKLKPAKFNFIVDPEQVMIGFLAHELQEVVPAAVSGTKDSIDDKGNPDYQCIDVSKIVPLIVKTIQELEIRVSEIEQSNEILETKNTELETKNTALETELTNEKIKVSTLETQVADLLARVTALENN